MLLHSGICALKYLVSLPQETFRLVYYVTLLHLKESVSFTIFPTESQKCLPLSDSNRSTVQLVSDVLRRRLSVQNMLQGITHAAGPGVAPCARH